MKEIFTQEMKERSLFSIGNTARLHRALDKARNGEKVTLAYIGGSITEGAYADSWTEMGYAGLSAKDFAETYMPDPGRLHYVNAGICGTPSMLGVTRAKKDVLDHDPDIVFVEYAVNDEHNDLNCRAYESLVRKLLNDKSQPAVILIFTLGDNGYSEHEQMKPVGRHYDLGMISVWDALNPVIQDQSFNWSHYGSDALHPHNQGHRFIADLIAYYFQQAESVPAAPYEVKEDPHYGNDLEKLENIIPGHPFILSEGDFPYGDVRCFSYKKGWYFQGEGRESRPMILKADARRMTIVFKRETDESCGTAEVFVDGEKRLAFEGYSPRAWDNPVTHLLEMGEGIHDVEIRMLPGEGKRHLDLVDMGYVQ